MFSLISLNVMGLNISQLSLTLTKGETILADNFSYDNAFTSNGWSSLNGPVTTPQNRKYGRNKSTITVGAGFTRNLRDNFSQQGLSNNDQFIIQYEVFNNVSGRTVSTADADTLMISDSFSTFTSQFRVRFNETLMSAGGQNCTWSWDEDIEHVITILLNHGGGVYDLYYDNAKVCDTLTIANDMDQINFTSLQLTQVWNANENITNYFDSFYFGFGNVSGGAACDEPSLFCDDFNRITPLTTNDWTVFTSGFTVDNSFAPQNNKLNLAETPTFISPTHSLEPFEVNYATTSETTTTLSQFAPLFSTEFNINISSGGFEYSIQDLVGRESSHIVAVVETGSEVSWYYRNNTADSSDKKLICANCTPQNKTISFKITTHFKQHPSYDFNSSFSINFISVFLNGTQYGDEINPITFLNDAAITVNKHSIIKQPEYKFIIDDYFVMLGTDKFSDTTPLFFEPLFIPENVTIVIGEGEEDMAAQIDDFWTAFGLISTRSRIIFGLFIMFIINVIILGMVVSKGVTMSVGQSIVINIILSILITFLNLFPVWIPILITIVSVGLFALSMTKHAQGG